MIDPDSVAPTLVFAPVFFYVPYGVIRAAVRHGILQADERRQREGKGHNNPTHQPW